MARFVAFGWKIGLGGSKVEGVNRNLFSATFRRTVVMLAIMAWSSLAFCGEIHNAVKKGDLEKINALLKENPDLASSKDYGGETPLHWAAIKGNKEVAELLLKYKADVNAKNTAGETPLHIAARHGHLEIAELLLANNADVNAENHNGFTPLDCAYKNVVELLRQHGGKNIGTATNSGEMFDTARNGNLEKAETLLKNNPNLALMKADNGWTALDYASFYNHTNVAKLLLDNKVVRPTSSLASRSSALFANNISAISFRL